MNMCICSANKEGLISQLEWILNKLKDEPEVETYHIVGDFDYKLMTMHMQQIAPMDSIDLDVMSEYLKIPKEVYEKVKSEYHFQKTMQAFNDTVDDDFEDN